MTIQEMHIDLDVNGQRLNSNLYADIRVEEKDLLINRAIKRFVNRRANPKTNVKKEGYEESTKRLSDLEGITETVPVPLYKKDNYTLKGILPYNYYQYINASSNTSFGCKNINEYLVEEPVLISNCLFDIKTDNDNYYKNFKITVVYEEFADVIIFDLNDYVAYSSGFVDGDEKFTLINLVLDAVNQLSDFELRWEKYAGNTYFNKFILTSTDTNKVIKEVHLDSDAFTLVFNSFISSYTNIKLNTTILGEKVSSDVRVVSSADYVSMVNSSMGRSAYDSVLTKIENDIVEVSHSNTFIPTSFNLTYIKEPVKVNLKIERHCDLNSKVHEEIMDIALDLLKSRLDGSYQITKNENLINE